MLIAIFWSSSSPVKATLVNWLPWSVLKKLRFAVPGQRLVHRDEAELHLQRDRQPPRQNPPAEPIHHRSQVDEAARHQAARKGVLTMQRIDPVYDRQPRQRHQTGQDIAVVDHRIALSSACFVERAVATWRNALELSADRPG